MLRKVELDELMAEREDRLRGYVTESQAWYSERRIIQLMRPGIVKGSKLGKRPVSKDGTFNQSILGRSPGSTRNKGLDFVKAVYSDRTGQETDWHDYEI